MRPATARAWHPARAARYYAELKGLTAAKARAIATPFAARLRHAVGLRPLAG